MYVFNETILTTHQRTKFRLETLPLDLFVSLGCYRKCNLHKNHLEQAICYDQLSVVAGSEQKMNENK